MIHKKKKILANKAQYSQLASNYFKWFITHGLESYVNTGIFQSLRRPNFSASKMRDYRAQTNGMFSLTEEIFYFYCPITNCRIVCPEELAYMEGLDFTIINGFNRLDFESIASSDNEDLHWSCYFYDSFDMDNMLVEV